MPVDTSFKPRVSVLVPVYNMEKYLCQCMDALCKQTLRNLEIICINDGSTDSSLAILQDYAARDARITIIDKQNSGYGASMNKGLAAARGEYIGIVESDDFPSRNMFEILYDAALKHSADLVKSNYYEHQDGHDSLRANLKGFPYKKSFDPLERPDIITTIPAIWSALYSRRMLLDNQINFRETPGAAFQDTSFVLKAWFASRRCVLIRKPLLHYRVDNPNSSVKTLDKMFVVCDELAESERFLRAGHDRSKVFLPWFHMDKWQKYRWNYERISPDAHTPFATRMLEEYQRAYEAGELEQTCFSEHDWGQVMFLLDKGVDVFVASYPEKF
ncbi:MAG: glycosyltransferase [Eggerthellaceae bacterium]|nr:glycosyltransferase [Eggerthellaceae bacterium]